MWNVKQKRCYQRIMSGILFNNSLGRVLRFLTFTTSKESDTDLQADFRVIKMRIKRRYGAFEYIRIRTNEGNGVLHILYVGTYIPQTWLSRNWKEIHNSPIVDIRSATRTKGLGRYIVSQYLSDQRCSFLRYSWSWGFVYRGFVGNWKMIRAQYGKSAVKMWNIHLSGYMIRLDNKYLKPPPDVGYVAYIQFSLELKPIDDFLVKPPIEIPSIRLSECHVCRQKKQYLRNYNNEMVCKSCYNE